VGPVRRTELLDDDDNDRAAVAHAPPHTGATCPRRCNSCFRHARLEL
jgi:hypothetical protein